MEGLPQPEGLTTHRFAEAGAVVLPKTRLDPGKAESLSRFQRQYAFFSPAILYLSGLFDDRQLCDFLATYKSKDAVSFFYLFFRRPLFAGLSHEEDPTWNHTLWAVDREHWAALEWFLTGQVYLDPATGHTTSLRSQDLDLLDPVIMDKPTLLVGNVIPLLSVTVFGLENHCGYWAYHKSANLLEQPVARYVATNGQPQQLLGDG